MLKKVYSWMAVLLSDFFTCLLVVRLGEFVSTPGMGGVVCLEKQLMILKCLILFESGCI